MVMLLAEMQIESDVVCADRSKRLPDMIAESAQLILIAFDGSSCFVLNDQGSAIDLHNFREIAGGDQIRAGFADVKS